MDFQITCNGGADRRVAADETNLPPVLDACCGSRMMWYDKQDRRALYVDKRCETHEIDIGTPGTIGRSPVIVAPDVVADFTNLPLPGDTFALVVLDPPHLVQLEETAGILTKKYGSLLPGWREMLTAGFEECFRVLRPEGVLILKWSETHVPISEVLALTPHKPLFGHQSGARAQTHWCAFLKPNASSSPSAEP